MTRQKLVLLLVVALVAAACSGDGAESSTTGGSDASVPQTETSLQQPSTIEVRLGMVAPLTGNLSSIGPGQAEGARVATEVIDAAISEVGLGDTMSVTLVGVEDSQGDGTAAVEAATKLVSSDIDVLVGSCATQETLAIAQSVTISREVVQISMCSSAPELSNLEDDGFAWQMIYPNTLLSAAFVQAAQGAFGETATINTGSVNDAGNGGARTAFDDAWSEAGGTIGASVAWNVEQPTYDTEAQQLVAGDPDGWVIYTSPEDWAKLGPALVRTGEWDPSRTIVNEVFRDAAILEDLGDPATMGLMGVSPTNEGSPSKEAFDDIFAALGDSEPTGFDSLGFDPVILAFLAAVRSGAGDSASIRDSLMEVSGPPGIKIGPDQITLGLETLLAGEDIDYEGGWGSIDWNEIGDPGSSVFEIWTYPGGGQEIPPGEIIVVTAS